jgi:hypothetical protein
VFRELKGVLDEPEKLGKKEHSSLLPRVTKKKSFMRLAKIMERREVENQFKKIFR